MEGSSIQRLKAPDPLPRRPVRKLTFSTAVLEALAPRTQSNSTLLLTQGAHPERLVLLRLVPCPPVPTTALVEPVEEDLEVEEVRAGLFVVRHGHIWLSAQVAREHACREGRLREPFLHVRHFRELAAQSPSMRGRGNLVVTMRARRC